MARVFLYASHHSDPRFKDFTEALSRLDHDVFRGYTYDNEKTWDQEARSWRPPASPAFFTELERERFISLEASSEFRFNRLLDAWGYLRYGAPEESQQLLLLLQQMDAFVAVQTEDDKRFMTGSANAMELLYALHLSGENGRPVLAHLSHVEEASHPWGREFLKSAIALPHPQSAAAQAVTDLLGASESGKNEP